MSTLAIDRMERAALIEFKAAVEAGAPWGRRRIVSMQGLEQSGLVTRITHNGLIVDWELTPEGELWTASEASTK
jgi:hypothetical protein